MEKITPDKIPAKRALAALDKPAATDVPEPAGRISPKVRAAIDAMVSGDCKNITAAAEKVGLARESLSRALNKPHVAEHLRQKVKRSLAVGAARAGATKLALLDSPNEMVRDRASSFVLGLAGIVPEAAPADRSAALQPGLQIVIYSPGTTVAPQVIGPAFDAPPLPPRTIDHENAQAE